MESSINLDGHNVFTDIKIGDFQDQSNSTLDVELSTKNIPLSFLRYDWAEQAVVSGNFKIKGSLDRQQPLGINGYIDRISLSNYAIKKANFSGVYIGNKADFDLNIEDKSLNGQIAFNWKSFDSKDEIKLSAHFDKIDLVNFLKLKTEHKAILKTDLNALITLKEERYDMDMALSKSTYTNMVTQTPLPHFYLSFNQNKTKSETNIFAKDLVYGKLSGDFL